MLQIAQTVLWHVFRMLTLRHDGAGLPTRADSGGFRLLMGMALGMGVVRTLLEGGSPTFAPLFFLLVGGLYTLGARHFGTQLTCLFMCAALGIDLVQSVVLLAGHRIPSIFLLLWVGAMAARTAYLHRQ